VEISVEVKARCRQKFFLPEGHAGSIQHSLPPVQLTFDPDPDRQNTVDASHERTRIDLYLPLTVSGISSDSSVQNQAVQVSTESPNGLRWHSKWQNVWRRCHSGQCTPSAVQMACF
jgi:hypothetical protein